MLSSKLGMPMRIICIPLLMWKKQFNNHHLCRRNWFHFQCANARSSELIVSLLLVNYAVAKYMKTNKLMREKYPCNKIHIPNMPYCFTTRFECIVVVSVFISFHIIWMYATETFCDVIKIVAFDPKLNKKKKNYE